MCFVVGFCFISFCFNFLWLSLFFKSDTSLPLAAHRLSMGRAAFNPKLGARKPWADKRNLSSYRIRLDWNGCVCSCIRYIYIFLCVCMRATIRTDRDFVIVGV